MTAESTTKKINAKSKYLLLPVEKKSVMLFIIFDAPAPGEPETADGTAADII